MSASEKGKIIDDGKSEMATAVRYCFPCIRNITIYAPTIIIPKTIGENNLI